MANLTQVAERERLAATGTDPTVQGKRLGAVGCRLLEPALLPAHHGEVGKVDRLPFEPPDLPVEHWVYLASTPDISTYYIIDDQKAGIGDRVCLTGSRGAPRWGTSCGTVKMLQAGGKYMVLAKDVCSTYGDNGGPFFAGHVAYGI